MKLVNKRGISSVVATILLVSLVLVAAALIFVWLRGLVAENAEKNGQSLNRACDNVKFLVERTTVVGSDMQIKITNSGEMPIYSFNVEYKYTGGESNTMVLNSSVDSYSVNSDVSLPMSGTVQKIIFKPMLQGKIKGKEMNKVITCIDIGQVLSGF